MSALSASVRFFVNSALACISASSIQTLGNKRLNTVKLILDCNLIVCRFLSCSGAQALPRSPQASRRQPLPEHPPLQLPLLPLFPTAGASVASSAVASSWAPRLLRPRQAPLPRFFCRLPQAVSILTDKIPANVIAANFFI